MWNSGDFLTYRWKYSVSYDRYHDAINFESLGVTVSFSTINDGITHAWVWPSQLCFSQRPVCYKLTIGSDHADSHVRIFLDSDVRFSLDCLSLNCGESWVACSDHSKPSDASACSTNCRYNSVSDAIGLRIAENDR